MRSTLRDRLRCFAKAPLVGASFALVSFVYGCSPYEESLSSHFFVVKSPSGFVSVSMLKDGTKIPKIPPSVIAIFKDDQAFYITRQYVQVIVKGGVPSLKKLNSYQYFILDRKTEVLKEVSDSAMLSQIIRHKSKIVSVDE